MKKFSHAAAQRRNENRNEPFLEPARLCAAAPPREKTFFRLLEI